MSEYERHVEGLLARMPKRDAEKSHLTEIAKASSSLIAQNDELKKRILALEAALKPFANYASRFDEEIGHAVLPTVIKSGEVLMGITTRHFRDARAMIETNPHERTKP